ncbi:MAG: DDE-type integrase/transposase/recombinase [Sneathiella sp.]
MVSKVWRPIARNLKSFRPTSNDIWYLDEMIAVIRGRRHFLWYDVDNEGEVLDFRVQSKRNTKAALKLMRKLLKKQGFAPSQIVTDKLKSYHKAFRSLRLNAEHIDNKRSNDRAENSHLPVRQRERKMQKFKSPGSAQRFLNIQSAAYNSFYFQTHLINRTNLKRSRAEAFGICERAGAPA